MNVSASIICGPGSAIAAGIAVPRKGALQGVATTVTKSPEKNEPASPFLFCRDWPAPVAPTPTSNTPNIDSPSASSSSRMT